MAFGCGRCGVSSSPSDTTAWAAHFGRDFSDCVGSKSDGDADKDCNGEDDGVASNGDDANNGEGSKNENEGDAEAEKAAV